MSCDGITDKIKSYISGLSEKRLRHTLGVERAALMLAGRHYPLLNPTLVSAAALLHDCTKELSAQEQAETALKYGVVFDETERETPKLWHAVTAAVIAKEEFGLPAEAASAIRCHTTGKADMSDLDKVVYLADFIEANRADALCRAVRDRYTALFEKSPETAVDKTLIYALENVIEVLDKECKHIHPHTIEARNFLKGIFADENFYKRS